MQLRLLSWLLIMGNLVEPLGGQQQQQQQQHGQQRQQQPSRVRRQGRTNPNMSQPCPGGCATCSEYNGCLTCKPRLFFFLERIGMRQIGVCLTSCPSGYYGTRFPEPTACTKCKADCEACFNSNFCTKCKNGFYLHLGKCLENCPEWLEPNNYTMECNDIVHCKTSEWSQWKPCMKKGKTCGFKRGNETRIREVLQLPSTKGSPCPHTSETRKCVVQRKKCPKRENKRRRKLKPDESKEIRQENRGQEPRRQNREQRENKSKMQLKKRMQDKQQKLHTITISTLH